MYTCNDDEGSYQSVSNFEIPWGWGFSCNCPKMGCSVSEAEEVRDWIASIDITKG